MVLKEVILKSRKGGRFVQSVWVCCINTSSVICILSGLPWHTALSQMDSLQNCLDSLLLDVTTEILFAIEGLQE